MWLLLPDTLARSLTLVSRQTKLTFSRSPGRHISATRRTMRHPVPPTPTNRVGASITFSLMRSFAMLLPPNHSIYGLSLFYLLNFNVTPKPMGTGMPVLSST